MFSPVRASVVLVAIAALAVAAEPAGTALTKRVPFAPEGGPAGAQAAANETIEFAGVSTVGKRTELIFFDKTSKKNYWIAKGETKEGITVLNYDSKREEAVVTINGTQKTLPMRQGAKVAPGRPIAPLPTGFNVAPALPPAVTPAAAPVTMTPAATPPPPAASQPTPPPANKPETPATPEAVAKAETEARMLVSDLLEIGMAQRKAYEDAQRRAAEGKTEPPAQTPQAPAPDQPKP